MCCRPCLSLRWCPRLRLRKRSTCVHVLVSGWRGGWPWPRLTGFHGCLCRVQSALSRRDDTIGNLQGAHNDLAAKKRSYAAARANAKGAASAEAAMARVSSVVVAAWRWHGSNCNVRWFARRRRRSSRRRRSWRQSPRHSRRRWPTTTGSAALRWARCSPRWHEPRLATAVRCVLCVGRGMGFWRGPGSSLDVCVVRVVCVCAAQHTLARTAGQHHKR